MGWYRRVSEKQQMKLAEHFTSMLATHTHTHTEREREREREERERERELKRERERESIRLPPTTHTRALPLLSATATATIKLCRTTLHHAHHSACIVSNTQQRTWYGDFHEALDEHEDAEDAGADGDADYVVWDERRELWQPVRFILLFKHITQYNVALEFAYRPGT